MNILERTILNGANNCPTDSIEQAVYYLKNTRGIVPDSIELSYILMRAIRCELGNKIPADSINFKLAYIYDDTAKVIEYNLNSIVPIGNINIIHSGEIVLTIENVSW